MRRESIVCLLLFLSICFLSLAIEAKAVGVAYIKSKTMVYPEGRNYVFIEETATLEVNINAPDLSWASVTYSLTVKVRGENITVSPSSEENISISDGWEMTQEFQLKPYDSGTLGVSVQLWNDNTQIDFTSLSLNVHEYPSIPVQIKKQEEYTFIGPNSVFLDSPTSILTTSLTNLGRFDEEVSVRVYSQNVEVEPNEQNLTIRASDTSSVEFRLTPQIPGTFDVFIELWFNYSRADLHLLHFSARTRSTIALSAEALLMPFFLAALISLTHFLKFRKEHDYRSWVSWGSGILVFFVTLLVVSIIFRIEGAFGDDYVVFDWVLVRETAKFIPFLAQLSNPEAALFNVSLSGLTLILVSYLSFLGLHQILDKYIAIGCGILIGFLSAITVYRLSALQGFYETLFAGFGFFPALILTVLIALIVLGLSRRIGPKQLTH